MTIPAIPESWQLLKDWAAWLSVISGFLYGAWRYVIRPRLAAPASAFIARVSRSLDDVDRIVAEMRPNGGGSMKDQMHRIEASVDVMGGQVSAIIDTAAQAIMRTGPRGEAEDVNRALEMLAGCSRRDLMAWGWVGRIHREDRDAVMLEWKASVQHRRYFAAEFRLVPLVGLPSRVRMVATPMLTPSKRTLLGWHAVITPLTVGQGAPA